MTSWDCVFLIHYQVTGKTTNSYNPVIVYTTQLQWTAKLMKLYRNSMYTQYSEHYGQYQITWNYQQLSHYKVQRPFSTEGWGGWEEGRDIGGKEGYCMSVTVTKCSRSNDLTFVAEASKHIPTLTHTVIELRLLIQWLDMAPQTQRVLSAVH